MNGITRRGLAAAPLSLAAAEALAKTRSGPAAGWPDATETAARIRKGELSALEAVEAAIDRAEALQPTLNVIVNSDFDRALARARSGGVSGPFAGVPFLMKDLDNYAGLPTRSGSQSARMSPPAATTDLNLAAYDRAGLVSLGKSATPEFGFLPTTEPVATGPTRNPWDPSRSSGGSSGGAAAAVAAGIVPVAHASDGGGSIRIPAACCGLFGLKPSRGRTLETARDRQVSDISVQHVVSRSVRDSAALLAITEATGADARFPRLGVVTGPNRRRLRIGLAMDGSSGPPSPEVFAAVEDAARLLTGLRHRVTPTKLPFDAPQFIQDFLLLWASGALQLAEMIGKAVGRKADATMLEPFSLGMAEMAAKAGPAAIPPVIGRLNAVSAAYDAWFNDFDVIVSPVLDTPAPPLGHLAGTVPYDTLVARLIEYVGWTPLHNVAGAPAMSVPLAWSASGLPIGVQFAARAGDERTLLELAYELERARPWAHRIPPVHA